jgi:hypothetical protein
VPLLARRVARVHHLLKKAPVCFTTAKVATAAQVQGLVHRRLEVPMRRLAIAILVRLAHIDPLADQAIVVQQPPIATLKLALDRQVIDRRAQAVAAMPPRRTSQFPQRVLQAVGQRLERLRRADGYRFPVGVGEHEVINQMLEALAEDGDSQGVHAGEIRGGQIARVMHLAKHDRTRRAGRGAPVPDAALEGTPLALRKLPGMLLQEPVEQRLGVQARLGFQSFLDLLPQLRRQRVLPRAISARPLLRAGQRTQRAILACGFFVHARPPGCDRQPLLGLQVPKQLPHLSIRDHRKPPVPKELRLWSIPQEPGILIVAGHTAAAILPHNPGPPGIPIVVDREK